jgi:KDO2-lipid IV(A) lauroyltransferase
MIFLISLKRETYTRSNLNHKEILDGLMVILHCNMSAVIYYILLPFIYLVSILPFWMMYGLSDLLCFFLFRLAGYRKKIVLENLRKSFPEKTSKEIDEIASKFYSYFCDLTLETLKTLTISHAGVKNHVKMEDTSLFERFYNEKRSVIIVMGHFGNWELAGARFSMEPYHTLYVIYHPLHNKYFDGLVYHMRTRLGNKLYSMNEVLRGMLRDRDKLTATAFIADQTPFPEGAYWTNFLNQDTPIFKGTAKIAKKLNYPIIYVSMRRAGRGQYVIYNELLVENPAGMAEDEISELHTKRLEQDIREQPEIWLWTHRRWKHAKA